MVWRHRGVNAITGPFFFGLLCSAALLGCGDSQRSVVPVAGRVTLDGRPLSGAGVNFQPLARAGETLAGRGSFAYCDDDGRFELETVDGRPGAVVTLHQVRIYGPKEKQASSDMVEGGATQVREVVPIRYNYETELTFPVPPDGTKSADFDLKTK